MRLTIAYSKIKKRNLVLINNDTHQRETLSDRPIRPPLKSACVKAIWDLFPQNERQVTKIHFQDMTRFKMVYYMSWLLPYLRSKTIFTLSNSFVFYWFLKCSMSHTSFSSLATCRSFCDNRSHMLLFKSKINTSKKHCIAADVTIFPSFPQSYHLHLHNCRLIYVLYEAQML